MTYNVSGETLDLAQSINQFFSDDRLSVKYIEVWHLFGGLIGCLTVTRSTCNAYDSSFHSR